LSGPAAGALGAALVTTTAGFERVLTLDGGGTSTDVSVVLEGEPAPTTGGRPLDRVERGLGGRAAPDHRGQRRRLPVQDPHDRRGHRRRRRRVGGLAVARGEGPGGAAVVAGAPAA